MSTPTTTATAAAAGSGGAAGGASAELEHEQEQEQGVDQGMGGIGFAGDNDELAVLAQSYFAQGQDFVRGVDDWWTFGQ